VVFPYESSLFGFNFIAIRAFPQCLFFINKGIIFSQEKWNPIKHTRFRKISS
jgi:hypothetical protein